MVDFTNLLTKFVTERQLPQELDPEFYRLVYSDLSSFDDAALIAHFNQYGRREGRIANAAAHRVGLIATIPKNARLLEIGPFTTPIFRGENVRYFDVLDREALIERAVAHRYPTDNCPEIHWVSPTGDLSIVSDRFEYLFSSHCIEHQPDLIAHLRAAANVLEPGGFYYLIIPDKRYCFDHFIPESTLGEILAAHAERRQVHTAKNVMIARVMTTHNNPAEHWRGHHDDPNFAQVGIRADGAEREFKNSQGAYIDVHAWQFTPESFRSVITGIIDQGLCEFAIERVYDTLFEQLEFNAVLRSTRKNQ